MLLGRWQATPGEKLTNWIIWRKFLKPGYSWRHSKTRQTGNILPLIGFTFVLVALTLYLFIYFFNWDSLHARLNSHYEAWSYKKGSTEKITGYRKSV